MPTKRSLRGALAAIDNVVWELGNLRNYLPEDESGARKELLKAIERLSRARELLRDSIDIPRKTKEPK